MITMYAAVANRTAEIGALQTVGFQRSAILMAAILQELNENQGAMIITQNGEAKAAIMGMQAYEALQETLAMLEMVAQGNKSKAEGRYRPAKC
jgi:prevent-host-death family protein